MWCSFTGFSLSWTASASRLWGSGDGSTLVQWASRDSLVGLRYLVRWHGDTRIGMVWKARRHFGNFCVQCNNSRPDGCICVGWAAQCQGCPASGCWNDDGPSGTSLDDPGGGDPGGGGGGGGGLSEPTTDAVDAVSSHMNSRLPSYLGTTTMRLRVLRVRLGGAFN